MTTVLLVRHGLTRLTGPVLAGWTPGLHLDERGTEQAARLAERLRPLPLTAVVSSPLDRCIDTAAPIAATHDLEVAAEVRLAEVRYGAWTGRELKHLVKEPLWKVVQGQPSAAVFPDGEGLRDVQTRALAAIDDWNARLGTKAIYVAVSHGDVIKAITADALGLHLDQFQRIAISPASVTVIRYTSGSRPTVIRVNDVGGAIDDLLPPKPKPRVRRSAAPRGSEPSPAD